MEDYKSNSLKSKEANKEEKKLEKVVSGKVKVKQKGEAQRFAENFISEDAHNVKSYIWGDILVPSIKKIISEIVTNSIDMILYGETGHSHSRSSSNNSGSIKPAYRSFYEQQSRPVTTYRSTAYTFNDIEFDTYADADEVLRNMIDIVQEYGIVTIAQMYDLVGLAGVWTDNNYGWTDLRSARIERTRVGTYIIKLPRVLPV